jgi:phage N-6-adenine-methyltransferase
MNKINSGLFSSNRGDWATPIEFFKLYDSRYHFTLDVCANEKNYKVKNYFSEKDNGLLQPWKGFICWMNPPYGREIYEWIEKAYNETRNNNCLVVSLLPARTDTRWFHNFIYHKAEIEFLKGRLSFDGIGNAPFPSMIVIW